MSKLRDDMMADLRLGGYAERTQHSCVAEHSGAPVLQLHTPNFWLRMQYPSCSDVFPKVGPTSQTVGAGNIAVVLNAVASRVLSSCGKLVGNGLAAPEVHPIWRLTGRGHTCRQ